jgi:hypothetical protein
MRFRWAVHVEPKGVKNSPYRILARKLEGKGPLGRPRHRLEGSIKLVIKINGEA